MRYDDMARILDRVSFPGWDIVLRADAVPGADAPYLQVQCRGGKCNVTGKPKGWNGRKWLLSTHMTETELVKTALCAVLAAQQHETLEKFTYEGVAIFDPHIGVRDLVNLRRGSPLDAREETTKVEFGRADLANC